MRASMIGLTLALLCLSTCPVVGEEQPEDIPDKAPCRTCEARGGAHGEEDVVAWRDYEGKRYYFCSKDCAVAFDDFPAAYIVHPIPRPAPNATVKTLDGKQLAVDDLKGKVVLLDFWATWCAPCRKSMPMLGELQAQWADKNFTVIGVSIDENAGDVVPKFVAKHKLDYPIVLDTTATPAWYAYHVAAIPAMFLIDEQGQIVAEWRGEVDPAKVRVTVESLLAKSNAKTAE
jgi:peroxiredoxin